jgi:hypothetical protein
MASTFSAADVAFDSLTSGMSAIDRGALAANALCVQMPDQRVKTRDLRDHVGVSVRRFDCEAAVIALARPSLPCLAIIDEKRGRRIAQHVYGLPVKGSAGLLVMASLLLPLCNVAQARRLTGRVVGVADREPVAAVRQRAAPAFGGRAA